MKSPALFLFFVIFHTQLISQTNNSLLNRKITLQAVDQPVLKILKQIEEQVPLHFSFNPQKVDVMKRMTVSFENKKISEIIFVLFTKNHITYIMKGNYIILSSIPEPTHLEGRPAHSNEKKSNLKAIVPKSVLPPVTDTVFKFKYLNSGSVFLPTDRNKGKDSMPIPAIVPEHLQLINDDSVILWLKNEDTVTTAPLALPEE